MVTVMRYFFFNDSFFFTENHSTGLKLPKTSLFVFWHPGRPYMFYGLNLNKFYVKRSLRWFKLWQEHMTTFRRALELNLVTRGLYWELVSKMTSFTWLLRLSQWAVWLLRVTPGPLTRCWDQLVPFSGKCYFIEDFNEESSGLAAP